MNLHSPRRRLFLLFAGLLAAFVFATLFALTVGSGMLLGQPYPTNYPPPKQTLEVGETQTLAAHRLTVPPATKNPFPVSPTSAPYTPIILLPHRVAGAGTIVDNGPAPFPAMTHEMRNQWFEERNGVRITVYAGGVRDTPAQAPGASQGFLSVQVTTLDYKSLSGGGAYMTPIKAGPIRIIDAVGERLVLLSETGVSFYFDVPTRQYVSSLTEIAPTPTLPIATPTVATPKPLYP